MGTLIAAASISIAACIAEAVCCEGLVPELVSPFAESIIPAVGKESPTSGPTALRVLALLFRALRPVAAFKSCTPGVQSGKGIFSNTVACSLCLDRPRFLGRHVPVFMSTPVASESEPSMDDASALTPAYVRPKTTAKEKSKMLSTVLAGAAPEVDLTHHDGQMRLLQDALKNGKEAQPVLPIGILSPKAMAKDFKEGEGSHVLDKGFPWQKHEYLDGAKENARVLDSFEEIFSNQTGAPRPDWIGLEMALDDPENLRAGLDLSTAYIKNHQLDRCELLLGRYVLPACLARGIPWVVKAMQSFATLRMKQNRNAEAMLVLEKLESMLPPHPIMLHNLGLAYNMVRMHDKAMQAFEKSVALKGEKMGYGDYWNIGITHMHKKEWESSFAMQSKALEMAVVDPDVDEVTLGKLYSSIGKCVQRASDSIIPESAEKLEEKLRLLEEAESYIKESVVLYNASVGATNLYGGAVHSLSKNLFAQKRYTEAESYLHEAMYIEAHKDGIHPTVCHYMIALLLELYHKGALPQDQLSKYHDLLRDMLMNLHIRGFAKDGNGGIVMHGIAEVFMLSGAELALPARALLQQGLKLVQQPTQDVQDTSLHQWMLRTALERAESLYALPSGEDRDSRQIQSEQWLLQGPWGVPEGFSNALGLPEPTRSE